MSDNDSPQNSPPAPKVWPRRALDYLHQSKPTEWLTVIITFVTATLTFVAVFRSGVIDAKRAEISAINERLSVDKIQLEGRKLRLAEEIDKSTGELARVRSQLLPLKREKDAIAKIVAIRRGQDLWVDFGFNDRLDGYTLSISTPGLHSNGPVATEAVEAPALGEILEAAGGMSNLTRLRLGGLRLRGDDVARIGGFDRLEELVIKRCRVDASALPQLRFGESLARLSLKGDDLASLPGPVTPNNVTELDLSTNPIDDEAAGRIAEQFPALSLLYLDGTHISGAGLRRILRLRGISQVRLYRTRVTREELTQLAGVDHQLIIHIEKDKCPPGVAAGSKLACVDWGRAGRLYATPPPAPVAWNSLDPFEND